MNVLGQTNTHASGRARWLIIDSKTGKIIRQSDWNNNLILNNGMDAVAARAWCTNFEYASVGTGNVPTYRTNGTITATQSGSIVTLSGSNTYFSAGDVANMLKWTGGNGDERRVTAALNGTQVTVLPATPNANSGAAAVFHTFHTNQTGLAVEVKRSNTWLVNAPNSQSLLTGNLLRHRRTYDFTSEAAPITYRELGFSWASTGANTHFSRIVLASPPALIIGQQLRVVYDLNLYISPGTPLAASSNVSGWPVAPAVAQNGTQQFQRLGLSGVTAGTGGTGDFDNARQTSEPANTSGSGERFWASTTGAAVTTLGAAPTSRVAGGLQSNASVPASYVSLDFYRDKFGIFTVGQANSTQIRSIGVGSNSNGANSEYVDYAYVFVWDENQTKDSEHTLTFRLRQTWTRNLVAFP